MYRSILVFIFVAINTGLVGQDLEKIILKDAGSGDQYELSRLLDKKAGVVIFFGNRCAYNSYYVDRLRKLASEFKPQGIEFILVNSNSSQVIIEESAENMKRKLVEWQLVFPYLEDREKRLKTALGASRSPEAFLLKVEDGHLKVTYSGAIDDSPASEGDVHHPYLHEAILSLLQNKKPAVGRHRPAGCLLR